MDETDAIVTDLPDLAGLTLAELRARADLYGQVAAAVRQAARPRKNLGSSGPPGRAD